MKWLAQGVILVMLAAATALVVGAMAIKQIIFPDDENEWDALQCANGKRLTR